MQMTTRLQHLLFPVVLATALASCDREEAPATATAPTPPPAKPAPAPMPVAAVPTAEDHGPDGGTAPKPSSCPPATGPRTSNTSSVSSGSPPAVHRRQRWARRSRPPRRTSAFKGETTWVGALFSVQAKDKSVFVSPRDLELRRGGVILNARHINQPLLPGCKPLLPAKQLRIGEDVSGFALFEVPKSFRTTDRRPDRPLLQAHALGRSSPRRGPDQGMPGCLRGIGQAIRQDRRAKLPGFPSER